MNFGDVRVGTADFVSIAIALLSGQVEEANKIGKESLDQKKSVPKFRLDGTFLLLVRDLQEATFRHKREHFFQIVFWYKVYEDPAARWIDSLSGPKITLSLVYMNEPAIHHQSSLDWKTI